MKSFISSQLFKAKYDAIVGDHPPNKKGSYKIGLSSNKIPFILHTKQTPHVTIIIENVIIKYFKLNLVINIVSLPYPNIFFI